MTVDVITVAASAPLEEVVETMEKHRIKRLPVVENNRVIGVVSRSDLLRYLIGHARKASTAATDDSTMRTAILDALDKQAWAPVASLNVTVVSGVVDIWGTITNDNERRAVCIVAENTPGVTKVHDHLVYIEPYSGTVIESPDEQR